MGKKFTEFLIRTITALLWGSIFWATLIFLSPFFFSGILSATLIWILIVEWKKLHGYSNPWLIVLTPMYPVAPFFMLIYLNQHTEYHFLLYYLFILVFASDTGAYIVGTLIGKHKIVPRISPHKSWEGLLGGYCLTLLLFQCMLWFFGIRLSYSAFIFISLAVTLLAFAGDIFESWLKRKAHIKDTSSIMPGHGGLLDRFDSVLAVTYFFFIMRCTLASLLLP